MKKGSVLSVLLLVLLVASLAFLGYLIYLNVPGTPLILQSKHVYTSQPPLVPQLGNGSESKQFYLRMRFPDRTITYSIDPTCSAEKRSEMLQAFRIIEKDTIVRFVPSGSAELLVSCSEVAPPPDSQGHFVAGEGGPYEILNTSSYAIILSARISLYKDESCSTPHIAVHELLHALGFDHNTNPASILYPTLDCRQTLDTYFVSDLNELYKEDSLPDLVITGLNGTKAGRYLSFSISVTNRGLVKSQDSNVTLFDDQGEMLKSFTVGTVDIGTTKILTVSNFAATRSAKEYRFIVDRENSVVELDESNNDASLSLS
jgi:hypothetical protein